MSSPLGFLRSGPPPPRVALLPDAAFFTRAVPVAAGATALEAASQVELALEAAAPFPLSQLYYGWFWAPGSPHALVFAAYRRRFTTDQTSTWQGAEVVLPGFAALLGLTPEPATTVVLASPESITAVHWGHGPVPTHVLTRVPDPEATEEDRARLRDELLREIGGSHRVIEIAAPLAPDPAHNDREIVFRSGEVVSRLPAAALAVADVRDKAELAAFRSARRRDVVLWRVTVGLAASLVVFGLGEFALVGGRMWQRVRERQFVAQKPLVEKIESIHSLTAKIEEMATKRLRPVEMLLQVSEPQPGEVWFTGVRADVGRGLNTLYVEGRTSNAALINSYESTLRKLPTIERVEAPITGLQGDQTRFTLTAVFKAGAQLPAVGETPKAP